MDYRVFSMSSGEDEDSTEAHVFARAYRAAWRSLYSSEPMGRHQVATLGLIFDFGAPAPARVGNSHAGATPASPYAEPASAALDVPPGGRYDH
jgi:hypothetical protein